MARQQIFFSLLTLLLTLPMLTWAQAADGGLVPCGDGDEEGLNSSCQMCHFVMLSNNINNWLVTILSVVVAVMFVVAGYRIVTAGGNASAAQSAKNLIINVTMGFIIVLIAWLIIDYMMKVLVGGEEDYAPWRTISCIEQPVSSTEPPDYILVPYAVSEADCTSEGSMCARVSPASFGSPEVGLSADELAEIASLISSNSSVNDMSSAALDAVGITDPTERAHFRALIMKESSDCQNKVGPDTGKGRGRAYGCVQTLVSTARALDRQTENRFAGKSNDYIAMTMRDDELYNIRLGAEYYRQGLEKYNGNIEYALARYNGGDAAMNPSETCPGQTWYQCEANSGYAQTRDYVSKISDMASTIR